MADQAHLTPARGGPAAVRSCWLCGIHLHPGQMMADGGSACADVRWYCLDVRGCTERWTSRPAEPGLRQDTAEMAEGLQQAPKLPRRRPTGAGIGRGDRSG